MDRNSRGDGRGIHNFDDAETSNLANLSIDKRSIVNILIRGLEVVIFTNVHTLSGRDVQPIEAVREERNLVGEHRCSETSQATNTFDGDGVCRVQSGSPPSGSSARGARRTAT